MNKQGSTVCECGRDDVHSTRDCWTLENKMKKYTDLNIWIHKLKQIMDEKKVLIWLCTPNKAFNDRTPMSMIMEGQTELLNAARQDRSKLIDVLVKLLTVLKLDISSQAMYNKDYE